MTRMDNIGGVNTVNRILRGGDDLDRTQVKSVRECTVKCLAENRCKSFNYKVNSATATTQCQLNSVAISEGGSSVLVPRDGYVYYEKVTKEEDPLHSSASSVTTVPITATTSRSLTENDDDDDDDDDDDSDDDNERDDD
ncbi:E3 ubiquitin-protein ligase RNF34-like [Lingula anatina]|uniref:E3 ubiquitin-protein ligase RNF34-like n=1 Tax=Lingula anatina TaxID=7574 RepID=A0A1S3JBK0_LINAN|nr:E3 ubiquitin-protein ligase RNF34-like [Lingula anatina]|eukprot:XP_013407708.1 E3 ubiquitin-protein ligase RNF34-like [Lingula anatina]